MDKYHFCSLGVLCLVVWVYRISGKQADECEDFSCFVQILRLLFDETGWVFEAEVSEDVVDLEV